MGIGTFLFATAHRAIGRLSWKRLVGNTMVWVVAPLFSFAGCAVTHEEQAAPGLNSEHHLRSRPDNEASQSAPNVDEQAGYTFEHWRRDKSTAYEDSGEESGGDGSELDAELSAEEP